MTDAAPLGEGVKRRASDQKSIHSRPYQRVLRALGHVTWRAEKLNVAPSILASLGQRQNMVDVISLPQIDPTQMVGALVTLAHEKAHNIHCGICPSTPRLPGSSGRFISAAPLRKVKSEALCFQEYARAMLGILKTIYHRHSFRTFVTPRFLHSQIGLPVILVPILTIRSFCFAVLRIPNSIRFLHERFIRDAPFFHILLAALGVFLSPRAGSGPAACEAFSRNATGCAFALWASPASGRRIHGSKSSRSHLNAPIVHLVRGMTALVTPLFPVIIAGIPA